MLLKSKSHLFKCQTGLKPPLGWSEFSDENPYTFHLDVPYLYLLIVF